MKNDFEVSASEELLLRGWIRYVLLVGFVDGVEFQSSDITCLLCSLEIVIYGGEILVPYHDIEVIGKHSVLFEVHVHRVATHQNPILGITEKITDLFQSFLVGFEVGLRLEFHGLTVGEFSFLYNVRLW